MLPRTIAMPDSFDPYHKWLGIPKVSRPPTHYQLLAITRGETDKDVINSASVQRTAYVRNFQSGKYATDATKLLNEISEANVCLIDPVKRAAYDAELRKKDPPKPRPQPAAAPAPMPVRPLVDPLLEQAAAFSAAAAPAPWMMQTPTRKQGIPGWALAAAMGGARSWWCC